jgi:hypothetical protein
MPSRAVHVIRLIPALLVAIALLPAGMRAQQMPNFSGIWELDAARSDDRVYGQLRVISHTPSRIHMTVFQVAYGQTSIIPWEFTFDRWRPRRGGDHSLEPVVQSRWDGNRLVTVKAPGTHDSVLWIWSLSDDAMTLTVDTISTSISRSFDFTVASAPRGFIPDRHIYTRVDAVDDRTFALGRAVIRFGRGPGAFGVTCATESCNVIDVVAGRRAHSRTLANGREAVVSLRGNTLITAAED